MRYYPVFMDIKDKHCLVVGGGKVGARKTATLLKCGALVTVVSQVLSSAFDKLSHASLTLKPKPYEPDDVSGMFFVFAATDNAKLNQSVKEDAARLNILCNIADSPDQSDFILPSIVQRGDLILGISTSGKSPAAAKRIRQELDLNFGEEWGPFLTFMGKLREKLLASGHAPDAHKKIFHTLMDKGVLELIKHHEDHKIDEILNEVLGPGYQYRHFTGQAQNVR